MLSDLVINKCGLSDRQILLLFVLYELQQQNLMVDYSLFSVWDRKKLDKLAEEGWVEIADILDSATNEVDRYVLFTEKTYEVLEEDFSVILRSWKRNGRYRKRDSNKPLNIRREKVSVSVRDLEILAVFEYYKKLRNEPFLTLKDKQKEKTKYWAWFEALSEFCAQKGIDYRIWLKAGFEAVKNMGTGLEFYPNMFLGEFAQKAYSTYITKRYLRTEKSPSGVGFKSRNTINELYKNIKSSFLMCLNFQKKWECSFEEAVESLDNVLSRYFLAICFAPNSGVVRKLRMVPKLRKLVRAVRAMMGE